MAGNSTFPAQPLAQSVDLNDEVHRVSGCVGWNRARPGNSASDVGPSHGCGALVGVSGVLRRARPRTILFVLAGLVVGWFVVETSESLAKARDSSSAPGEIRTPDLLIRSQMLYPVELRALGSFSYNFKLKIT